MWRWVSALLLMLLFGSLTGNASSASPQDGFARRTAYKQSVASTHEDSDPCHSSDCDHEKCQSHRCHFGHCSFLVAVSSFFDLFTDQGSHLFSRDPVPQPIDLPGLIKPPILA